jgi:hypothetical protein
MTVNLYSIVRRQVYTVLILILAPQEFEDRRVINAINGGIGASKRSDSPIWHSAGLDRSGAQFTSSMQARRVLLTQK